MIRALVVAAIMLVAASLEASAQDRIIFGEAGTSCRTWTQARQTKSRKAGLSAQWVAGYLSGSNVEADHPDVLVATDFDGLMAWIENYCRANPHDLVGTAALKLFDELHERSVDNRCSDLPGSSTPAPCGTQLLKKKQSGQKHGLPDRNKHRRLICRRII